MSRAVESGLLEVRALGPDRIFLGLKRMRFHLEALITAIENPW